MRRVHDPAQIRGGEPFFLSDELFQKAEIV